MGQSEDGALSQHGAAAAARIWFKPLPNQGSTFISRCHYSPSRSLTDGIVGYRILWQVIFHIQFLFPFDEKFSLQSNSVCSLNIDWTPHWHSLTSSLSITTSLSLQTSARSLQTYWPLVLGARSRTAALVFLMYSAPPWQIMNKYELNLEVI